MSSIYWKELQLNSQNSVCIWVIQQKKQSWMDLPKILLTGLFFLVFLEFLGSWAWDSKNLEKNQINQKKQKKQSWMDLPKILLTGLVFLFFLVFLEFLGSWVWDSKNREKNQINQKTTKKILNGLAQDSSHRIDFFYFDINLGMKKSIVEKQAKKQHMQKPNAPSVPFCFFTRRYIFELLFFHCHLKIDVSSDEN